MAIAARNKNMLITAGIALVVAAGVVWAFNNVKAVNRTLK